MPHDEHTYKSFSKYLVEFTITFTLFLTLILNTKFIFAGLINQQDRLFGYLLWICESQISERTYSIRLGRISF
jgi:hypothetical protein